MKLVQHVDFERAKTAAEVDVLGGGDLLVAEYQDVVVEVCAVDAGEIFVVNGLGDVQAQDFCAYGGGEGPHFEVLRRGFCLWGSGHTANVGFAGRLINELFVGNLWFFYFPRPGLAPAGDSLSLLRQRK
jgi:hypothetical protein